MTATPPTREPCYRGALCKTVLERLALESWGHEVLAQTPREDIRAIEACRGLSWLPAAHLDALNRACMDAAGRDGYLGFWRRYTARTKDSVLFGPLFSGAFRIFGKRPEGFLRWVGRAWDTTTRNYGRIIFTERPESTTLVLSDIPPAGRLATVAASLEGSMLGVFDLAGLDGWVDVDETRLADHGEVGLVASWDSASPGSV